MVLIRDDEQVTPAGRLFLQPQIGQVIHCLLGARQTLNINAVKSVIKDSLMIKHPRFSSIMVTDNNGREHWRRTTVDIDKHVIVLSDPIGSDEDEAIGNDYLADLAVSSPLSTDKPLWEIHLLVAHNCAVLRVHHALGDGISLMSMLLTCCRKAEDPEQLAAVNAVVSSSIEKTSVWLSLWRLLKMVAFTFVYVLEFVRRSLWTKDKTTAISGGAGVELWPRKSATAKFRFDDMKTVKNAVPHATINDVLWGVISYGLLKYLDMRSPNANEKRFKITGVAMVNLRPQPGLQEMSKLMENNPSTSWGNKFGMILLPVYYEKDCYKDPLNYVKKSKEMIDRKKLSLESYFSYKIGYFILSILGPKFASILNYRILCNTTFTISNIVGPAEHITIADHPVEFMRATSTSLPHAITMHMLTYAGRADMQILVAKDIIPDPQVLATCFEDALIEMKNAATSN